MWEGTPLSNFAGSRRWVIKFDPRGKDQLKYRCKHVNLVKKAVTHVPGEEEYLFAPYSCGLGAQSSRHENGGSDWIEYHDVY